jgi:magnesium transporter
VKGRDIMTEPQTLNEQDIAQLVRDGRWEELWELIEEQHPADIADLLELLPSMESLEVFQRLPVEVASEVLDEAGGTTRVDLLTNVNDEFLADLLDELPMDDAVGILEDLPDPVSESLIELMEPDEAQDVRLALEYEKETAGRLMTTDIAALKAQWTVEQAFDYLRSRVEIEQLYYLYVVDQHHRLVGVVPLRGLIHANPGQRIAEIMSADVIAVSAEADREQVADLLAKYDFAALPVVNASNRLVGVITVDDIIDVFQEEATEDIQRLGGSLPLERPYFSTPVFSVFQKRIGWLLLLFAAGTLTGLVTQFYKPTWSQFLVLASFVPLVIGTGGNSGSQTIATIIRAITTGEVRFRDLGQAWLREVTIGLLLGLVMGAIALLITNFIWREGPEIAVVIALTLPLVVMWSTTVGTIVPIVADRLHIDPAVISGPLITTIVDVTGLIIYYTLAGLILGN